jgi:hypothetical protein
MLAPLATGTFSAGPKDDVATADVYKLVATAGKGMITSIQELSEKALEFEFFSDTLKQDGISEFLKKNGATLEIDTSALTNRLLEASSEFKGAFRDLSATVRGGAAGLLASDKAKDVMCMVDDVKSKVSAANLKDIRQLGALVNSFTGTKLYSGKDNSAVGKLLGSVIGEASKLNLGGVFTTITSTITDYPLLTKVVKAALPLALKNGDMKLLMEMSNSPAAKLINIFSPGFANTLAQTFKFPSVNGTRAGFNSFDDFLSCVGNVDSDWDTLVRKDDRTGTNILSLLGGSRDFQKLMLTGINWWVDTDLSKKKTYALASVYKQTSVYAEIRKHFPQTTLMSLGPPALKANAVESVRDPRVLKQSAAILFS